VADTNVNFGTEGHARGNFMVDWVELTGISPIAAHDCVPGQRFRGGCVMRAIQFLHEQHVPFEEVLHAPAFTAQKLARFLHVSGRSVVKSVLLVGKTTRCLAVLAATDAVNLTAVSQHFGEEIRLATPEEIAQQFNDCERGAMTPFGHLYGLVTILDAGIPADAQIIFESERHAVAIRMSCADFERIELPARVTFAHPHSQPRAS
jgi:Ala-tRNA(Pro) deacylase